MKNIETPSFTLRSLLILAALVSALAVSGCNTMRGVGQDTEAAGESIQRASR